MPKASPAPRPPSAAPLWSDFACAFGVLGAALLAYLPALRGGILWDDLAHVTRPELRSLEGLRRIWLELGATQQYYPLLNSAFWVEYRLWGDAVLGYHLTNVILQALSACLLAGFVRRLVRGHLEARTGAAVGWVAAFLFAVHPVCVESVAWITEQKNTLSMAFCLAAAFTYLGFEATRRRWSYWLALGLFALALMSKTTTTPLPAVLLVALWWKRGAISWRRDVVPLLPWFAIALGSGLFTAWVEQRYFVTSQVILDGSAGVYGLGPAERLLLSARILAFYLGKTLWPQGLIFTYPRWVVSARDPVEYGYAAGILLLIAGLVWLARKNRAPLAGFLAFAGMLFPVLGFFNVYSFRFSYVADHFQYLATLGIIVPLAAAVVLGIQALHRRAGEFASWAAGALLVVAIAALTRVSFDQSRNYRNSETFYRRILAQNPDAWMAHVNLALILAAKPDGLEEALPHFLDAVRIDPSNGELHNQLGSALARIPGHQAEAMDEFRTALRLSPSFPYAHLNLAIALLATPDGLTDAVTQLSAAIALKPDLAQAHMILGLALSRQPGNSEQALNELWAAVRIDPSSPDAHTNLAIVLASTPEGMARAMEEFRAVVRLTPESATAHYNLGCALASLEGHEKEAIAELQETLRLDPTNEAARARIAQLKARNPRQFLAFSPPRARE